MYIIVNSLPRRLNRCMDRLEGAWRHQESHLLLMKLFFSNGAVWLMLPLTPCSGDGHDGGGKNRQHHASVGPSLSAESCSSSAAVLAESGRFEGGRATSPTGFTSASDPWALGDAKRGATFSGCLWTTFLVKKKAVLNPQKWKIHINCMDPVFRLIHSFNWKTKGLIWFSCIFTAHCGKKMFFKTHFSTQWALKWHNWLFGQGVMWVVVSTHNWSLALISAGLRQETSFSGLLLQCLTEPNTRSHTYLCPE